MKKLVLAMMTIFCTAFTAYFFFSSPETRLHIALKSNLGSAKDVFVMKRAFGYGEAHPVALIFGYVDDYHTCTELLKDHYEKYPQTPTDAFFCQYTN